MTIHDELKVAKAQLEDLTERIKRIGDLAERQGAITSISNPLYIILNNYEKALKSIANSICCVCCREAANVARKVLKDNS